MEESFFTLKAVAGSSWISMTSVALTTLTRSGSWAQPQSAAAERTSASRPTSTISRSWRFLAAFSAPLTISPGALSPPMASTMIFICPPP